MKLVRKLSLIVTVIGLCGFVLTGCGDNNSKAQATSQYTNYDYNNYDYNNYNYNDVLDDLNEIERDLDELNNYLYGE